MDRMTGNIKLKFTIITATGKEFCFMLSSSEKAHAAADIPASNDVKIILPEKTNSPFISAVTPKITASGKNHAAGIIRDMAGFF